MFHQEVTYPLAVTSPDPQGLKAGIEWCASHIDRGDRLTVWTHLKSNLDNSDILEKLVKGHPNVDHVAARGGGHARGRGPVLMAWPDPADIADFTSWNSAHITALCVIAWNPDKLRPWVSEAGAALLGDTSAWDVRTPQLDPVVLAAMESITLTINHGNTIAAGYDKDDVVSGLLALHDAGYRLDGPALAGWAVAHGWKGRNPELLEKYVQDINRGSRPRVRRGQQPGLIDYFRAKAAEKN